MAEHDCEYTLDGTIEQLSGWQRGQAMYPIDVAISAEHWLVQYVKGHGLAAAPTGAVRTLAELRRWLGNEEPELPESLALETLQWLRVAWDVRKGGGR